MNSLWGLFIQAEIIVQLVMLGLLFASIWSWSIIIHKTIKLKKTNTLSNQFEELFWSGISLSELYERTKGKVSEPLGIIFCAGMREWNHSYKVAHRSKTFLEQRIERVMYITGTREIESLEKNVGFLSSLGSNAVIIGLFGTVLGIMHSFQSIAMQQNANLAVVAPGIAEALFATAIGLIAAIPASIAYNKISHDITRYSSKLETFSAEFLTILSRRIEENVA